MAKEPFNTIGIAQVCKYEPEMIWKFVAEEGLEPPTFGLCFRFFMGFSSEALVRFPSVDAP